VKKVYRVCKVIGLSEESKGCLYSVTFIYE